MRRATLMCAAALLVGGCSFIQSWGEFRDDEGGMDSGPGGADAGFDAETDCNTCESEGCDTTSFSCQFVDEDSCFECVGGFEGAECDEDGDCINDLVCEMGFCLVDCESTGGDCSASSIGGICGAPDTDRMARVCINHDCDPRNQECDGDACTIVPDTDNPGDDVASFCARVDNEFNPDEACTPVGPGNPVDRCLDSYACTPEPPGSMTGVCRRVCTVADPEECDAATEVCVPIRDPSGGDITYFGDVLGVCRPQGMECTGPRSCDGNPAGPICYMGLCSQCSPMGSDCNAVEVCRDGDGDGRFTCDPMAQCMGDADCTLGTRPRCIEGRCAAECSADTECVAGGWRRCRVPRTMPGYSVCLQDCSGGACTDGSRCEDWDGDASLDCLVP